MSAHFDGGEEIAGRRLRDVEVLYVDDPTLNLEAEESDECPPSPPPTYYLRVRSGHEGGGVNTKWAWRYVNVENKALSIWSRRGGELLRSIPLGEVETIRVLPDQCDASAENKATPPSNPSDQESPPNILELRLQEDMYARGDVEVSDGDRDETRKSTGGEDSRWNCNRNVLILQARSRTETLLWAKVLQENVELMTKRIVPLENLDNDVELDEVQQLGKLLMHQLSELKNSQDQGEDGEIISDIGGNNNQH